MMRRPPGLSALLIPAHFNARSAGVENFAICRLAQTMIWGAPRQIKADANTEKGGRTWVSFLIECLSFVSIGASKKPMLIF